MALALPSAALAAQPPTITSAGINGADQPYITWALGPGTTYDLAQIATAPALEPGSPWMFNLDNVLGYECGDLEDCPVTPAATSYTMTSAVPRDRRYYAMVSAAVDADRYVASAVWVIDEAKPLIAGQLPDPGDASLAGVGSGVPSPGRLLAVQPLAPPPPAAVSAPVPTASIAAPKLPRKIGDVLRRGIRVSVTCSVRCDAAARLMLNGKPLATRHVSPAGAGSVTFTVRPKGAARRRLRARRRARLQIAVTVSPAGGVATRLSRAFFVSR